MNITTSEPIPAEYMDSYRLGYEGALSGDEMNNDYRHDQPNYAAVWYERTGYMDGYKARLLAEANTSIVEEVYKGESDNA